MASYAVVLKEQGVIWGPFAARDEAEEFADFVSAEIDPAEVHVLCSAAGELLTWRKTMTELANG